MSRPVVCSEALLTDISEEEWTDSFDRVLKAVLENNKPGYIQVPQDAWYVKVSKKGLQTKLVNWEPNSHGETNHAFFKPTSSSALVQSTGSPSKSAQQVLEAIAKRLEKAQDPVILVDRAAGRFGLTDEINKLAVSSGLKVFTSKRSPHVFVSC